MADDGVMGTTVNLGSATITDVIDIGYEEDAGAIDITDTQDTDRVYIGGPIERALSLTTTGVATQAINATGSVTVNWNDGTTDSNSNSWFLAAKNRSGSVGGPINTVLTFKRKG